MQSEEREWLSMWYTERKNGRGTRYVYQERFTDPKTLKTIVVSVTLGSKSRIAQKQAIALLQEKADKKMNVKPKAEPPEEKTLKEVFDEWREFADLSVKPGTQKNHKISLSKILQHIPEGMLLRDFTPGIAEKIFHELYYGENLKHGTMLNTLSIFRAAMKWAQKAGYIEDASGFVDIKLKAKPLTEKELQRRNNKFLSAEELEDVLRQLMTVNERIAHMAEFQTLTGLRGGELLGLRWCDVDINKRELKVTGTLLFDGTRGTPKNAYSYRTLGLPERAVELLKWFQTDNKRLKMWSSGRYKYKESGYIFVCRSGNPYFLNEYNTYLKKAVIPGKHITSHIFRHTATSMMIAAGLPLKVVMQRLGQNNPATTLKVYTHVTEEMKQQEMEVLEGISAKIGKK